jgi:hypothetical protein
MKKILLNSIKSRTIIFVLCLFASFSVKAQTWPWIYDGSVLPNLATPAWTAADAGTGTTYSIIDESGNSVLFETSTAASDKNSWKLNTKQPINATWLIRTKTGNNKTGIEFEINAKANGTVNRGYFRLINSLAGTGVLKTNYLSTNVTYPTSDSTLTVKSYHTYRITVANATDYNIYIDENVTPVATGTCTSTSNTQFLRFGDVGSNFTEGYIDWMACDTTGAYAPGTTLPAGVIVDGASAPTIPSAPVATAATNLLQTGFTANWNPSTGATAYKLDVATDAGFLNFVTGYNNLDVPSGNSVAVTGLTANTTYYYQVRAYNTAGTSGNSNAITVTTSAGGTVLVTEIAVAGEGGATTIATKGGTLQMHANVSPDNAADTTFTWSVNNTAIATIDAAGLLKAVTDGKVAVKATAHDASGIVGIDTITISNQILVTGIAVAGKANATTISTKGGTLQMFANVSPDNASDTTITWSVDKTTVATIGTTTGLLTAVANGTVVVTATAHDGSGITGTATVTVSGQNVGVQNVNAEPLTLSPNPASDVLNISNAASIKEIKIISLQGQVLKTIIVTSDKLEVNISDLQPGLYIVRGDNGFVEKLQKN